MNRLAVRPLDSAQDARRAASGARRHGNAILAILVSSYFMIVLNISLNIMALPTIKRELGLTVAGLSWVQNTYSLTFGGLLLLGARAGDILGRRPVILGGLGLFTSGALVISLSLTPAMLLVGFALQGIGASMLAPATLALLSTTFPNGPQRIRAFGFYSATVGVSASVGLVLGGVFATWPTWRLGYFLDVPLGTAVFIAAKRDLPFASRRAGNFDAMGAACSSLGVTAIIFGVIHIAEKGWTDGGTLVAIGLGVALIAVFIVNEGRAVQPILPLALFASRLRVAAYSVRMLFQSAMVAFWFFSSLFLQSVLGYSPLRAGLAFLATTIPNFVAALTVPRLIRRWGNGPVLCMAVALATAGMAVLGQISAHASYAMLVAPAMALIGLGQGWAIAPITASAMVGVGERDAGAASGMISVAQQLGGSFGLSILVVVFSEARPDGLTGSGLLAARIATCMNVGASFLVMALVILAGLIGVPGRRSGKNERVDPA